MDISVVIPAYNEEGRIGAVLSPLLDLPFIKEIIVVNDGSTDSTSEEAKKYSVMVIDSPINQGKASAMKRGILESNGDWILFLDADLKGLKKEHITSMIQGITSENIDMVIGLFTKGKIITDLSHKIAPFLSGQRLIKKRIVEQIPFYEHTRYGIELIITEYMYRMGYHTKKVYMPCVEHVCKENKRGWVKGKAEKYAMYNNIISTFLELHYLSKWKWIKRFIGKQL